MTGLLKQAKTKKIIAQLLRDGRRINLPIQGDSMAPAIRDGDILTIEGCGYAEVNVGDVVVYGHEAFLEEGPFIAHRVLRKENVAGRPCLATRGDAAHGTTTPFGEEQVVEERILGKVIHVARPFLRKKRSPRLAAAKKMAQMARCLHFFSAGLLPREGLMEYNRRYFASQNRLEFFAKEEAIELSPQESVLVERFALPGGNALVLGCGSGREAIALANLGFKVTGIDYAIPLLDLAKGLAVKAGIEVNWLCTDITGEWPGQDSFDLITLFGQLYSHIPGRSTRVALLKRCRRRLKPGGVCLLNFLPGPPPSPREIQLHRWRKLFARVVRGNKDCEPGDHWRMGESFYHTFTDIGEIAEEAREAGFHLVRREEEISETMAVLKWGAG